VKCRRTEIRVEKASKLQTKLNESTTSCDKQQPSSWFTAEKPSSWFTAEKPSSWFTAEKPSELVHS